MPTYQYACTTESCGNRFELVQSFTDPAARECPVCGGPVRKVFSAVGVVFKGSGFYRTDSRSGSSGSSTTTAKASGDSASSDSSSKSSGSKDSAAASGSSSSSSSGSSSSGSSGSSSAAAAASA
jgi:putative FmdB family regulatory protein